MLPFGSLLFQVCGIYRYGQVSMTVNQHKMLTTELCANATSRAHTLMKQNRNLKRNSSTRKVKEHMQKIFRNPSSQSVVWVNVYLVFSQKSREPKTPCCTESQTLGVRAFSCGCESGPWRGRRVECNTTLVATIA